jgi:hypothetical protein
MTKMLQDQVGVDYSKNDVAIPKVHQKNLMSCFTYRPIHYNSLEKWFVVTKPETEKWLSKNIPVYSEAGPVFVIGDHAFKVWFDWNLQKFLVSA